MLVEHPIHCLLAFHCIQPIEHRTDGLARTTPRKKGTYKRMLEGVVNTLQSDHAQEKNAHGKRWVDEARRHLNKL